MPMQIYVLKEIVRTKVGDDTGEGGGQGKVDINTGVLRRSRNQLGECCMKTTQASLIQIEKQPGE